MFSTALPRRPSAHRLADGLLVRMRAIEPRDRDRFDSYLQGLSAASRYNRLLGAVNRLSSAMLDRWLRMDGSGGLVLLAFVNEDSATDAPTLIAEAMQIDVTGEARQEIALSVADAWQRRGIGTALLGDLEQRARSAGFRGLFGDILRGNTAMKNLACKYGYSIGSHAADAKVVVASKSLLTA